MLNKGSATELHPWSGLLPENMLMSEGCVELALAWASWDSWPWGHESRRADPTPSKLQYPGECSVHDPGSTVELALVVGVVGDLAPRVCTWRAGPASLFPSGGMDEGEMPSTPLALSHLPWVGALALKS